ncbi:hypothetical protein HID58_006916 [Brassica napus]|uniref:Uncharacterized protein n=1 Tax=Brassica napus TaxID=3708 RepID=A0ABQ8ECS4_BRANA|nr:hypothetical protein HID58_006916 [Brassica napus]
MKRWYRMIVLVLRETSRGEAKEEAENKPKGSSQKGKTFVKQCVKVAEKGHVKPANYLDSHQKILIGIATKGDLTQFLPRSPETTVAKLIDTLYLFIVIIPVANCQRQAEERLKRSVVMVQATFMSKQAQENYRRMKLTHEEAQSLSI